MSRLVFGLVVVLSSSVFCPMTEAAVQWAIEDGGNGHYYELVYDKVTWPVAKTLAEQMSYQGVSGHLVTITSSEEETFVIENVFSSLSQDDQFWMGAWIGLTDNEQYGGSESSGRPDPQTDGWAWVTGEPVSYTDWRPDAPNDFGANEDYALMAWHNSTGWNDQSDYHSPPFMVEYDTPASPVPEPSTLVLWSVFGALAIAVGWCRRRKAC
ncbi:MAG TPA: lectin-like protein [Thermoguttaceae bacterium]|nr:lectin-like protein [Thermoguttaceae bacterium]